MSYTKASLFQSIGASEGIAISPFGILPVGKKNRTGFFMLTPGPSPKEKGEGRGVGAVV
ncbi:MAG: hypothetical protein LBS46_08455 [Dysgonamonadaceae bacterium]|jgi:hypothetical protein|nr:hypothetical protein [Dysgonamonadaceae bacterium]